MIVEFMHRCRYELAAARPSALRDPKFLFNGERMTAGAHVRLATQVRSAITCMRVRVRVCVRVCVNVSCILVFPCFSLPLFFFFF